jgi:hypothetical protein
VLIGVCLGFTVGLSLNAQVVSATVQNPPPAATGYFKLGATRNPAGHEIGVNSRSLLFDGQPVFPVMGEIHYSRVPQAEWREELFKLKAGGVNIVATYVFWIHHEEIQGQWDWSGQRDLRKFIQTCSELGLKAVVRCGPWCHGEVRNGGFPDWVQQSGWKLRSTDPNFLTATKTVYEEIARQLQGQLWKDGGPVIGIQVDNANPLLRIRYVGDVARLTLNGKLIADNFYAGREFDLGLKRYGQEILNGDLRLELLPLRKDAPIYIEPKDRPDFEKADSLAEVHSVQLINARHD